MLGFAKGFGLNFLARIFPATFGDFNQNRDPIPDGVAQVEAISGGAMMVKRKAIDAIGAWDEGYFLHVEDLDYCMRFAIGGWRIMFVPDARAIHVKGASSRARPIFVEWHKHKGMIRFYNKFFARRPTASRRAGVSTQERRLASLWACRGIFDDTAFSESTDGVGKLSQGDGPRRWCALTRITTLYFRSAN